MPGVEEVVDAYANATARGPRYVVVSEGWVWRYLIHPSDFPTHGHQLPPTQVATGNDASATDYFRALVANTYGPYRVAHVSGWTSETWPRIEIHGSTSREIWIYEAQP
jgi:hypothetical protein